MRRITWTTVVLVLVLGFEGLAIQSRAMGQERGRQKDPNMTTASETISGRVKKVLKNDRGDVDGLLMDSGATVHFPPHMGDAVTRLVGTGDRIEVRGREQTLPEGEVVFEAERIESGKQSIDIDAPPPPREARGRGPRRGPGPGPGPVAEPPMNVTGTVKEFATNRHGDVDGILLSDGTDVKVPPHQGDDLQALVKVGGEVRVEGRRHETPRGEIHLHADRIVATSTGRTFERDEPRGRKPAPPHEEILQELRELRQLIESQQKK